MKKGFAKLLLALCAGALLWSCSNEQVTAIDEEQAATTRYCNQTDVVDFIAGQNLDVGDIIITQDNDFLTIKIDMSGGWKLDEYHIYVGVESEIPLNKKGNPRIGHFPYSEYLGGWGAYTIHIPISEIGFIPIIISVHGVVSKSNNEETAWGQGIPFDGDAWGMYFEYVIEDCSGGGTLCTGFKTLTQSEWGDPSSEGGSILTNQFSELAPLTGDIAIGCAFDSIYFFSGAAVLNFLPDTSPVALLTQSYNDPTVPLGKLAGELIALRLNLAADANILGFSTAESSLGDQTYTGSVAFYVDLPVNEVFRFAQQALGSCFPLDLNEAHDAVKEINENYANGMDNGNLDCPFD